MWVGLWRKLSAKELMLLNCGVGRRLLRVPWTARRSNQSILKEINPEYSLERLMLKLKLQYFGHLVWKLTPWERPWCWERLKGGGEGDNRGWDGWMVSLTQWIWVWTSSGSWWWTGKPGVLQSMGMQSARHDWATMLNWTDRYLRRRQSKEQKKLFEEIIAEKFPNLEKKTHPGPRSRVPNKIT